MSNKGHVFVSSTREYVLFAKDVFDPSKQHIYKITPPDTYANNEVEARRFFYDMVGSQAEITNCLPYDFYARQTLEKVFDDPLLMKKAFEMKKAMSDAQSWTTSPTRNYVMIYKNSRMPNKERLQEFVLPAVYINDVIGAANYYKDKIDSTVEVIRCWPREKHLEEVREKNAQNMNKAISAELKSSDFTGLFTEKRKGSVSTEYDRIISKDLLIEKIRNSLASFYGILPDNLRDLDILKLIEKLETDNSRYLVTLMSVNQAMKNGERREK